MHATTRADEYEPTGDPDHAAYASDFYYACSCGKQARYLTTRDKAEHRAQQHERYCPEDGETEIRVV
jgi:hypothetical protein